MVNTKSIGARLILGILLGLILGAVFWFTAAFASVTESARGFAWSGGVNANPPGYAGMGWISMNNVSDPTSGQIVNYGVNIPSSDGDLSGYAWNNYYGWISFNGADLAGTTGGGCGSLTQARRVGNALTGGARIIAIKNENGNSGGYNGCVGLSGVTIVGNSLVGFAWSSDLGWIDMSGVTFNGVTPPTGLVATPNASCGSKKIDVTWNTVTNATTYVLRDGATAIYTGNGTTYTHTVTTDGSSHNYTVRAEAGSQISNWSSVVVGVAPSACGAPSGTLNAAPSCTINIGEGTCIIPGITWSVSNPASPVSSALKQNGATLSSVPGTTNSGAITYGIPAQNTITVTDTGAVGPLASFTPEGVCAVDSFWNGTICTQPNLTVDSFTIGGTAYTGTPGPFTQGVAINLVGIVKNSGTVATDPTKTFTDNFTYSWDDGATWLPILGSSDDPNFDGSKNSVLHGSLAKDATANDNKIFTPDRAGNLRLQYCIDSTDVIKEGVAGEGSNCVKSAAAPVSITVNPNTPVICDPAQINNCSLPLGNQGDIKNNLSCSVGYTGSCDATCIKDIGDPTKGAWSITRNSCQLAPLPVINSFKVCDNDGVTGCTSGTKVVAPIPGGVPLKLKWDSTNADKCEVSVNPGDFEIPGNTPNGQDDINADPLAGETKVYTIVCSKDNANPAFKTVSVRTSGPDISVDKRIVNIGDKVKVEWKPAGGTCTVKGGGLDLSNITTDGSQSNITINASTSFVLNCGPLGSDTVRVDVIGSGFET